MAVIKSIDFLPSIFRSTANKKFLNATLDQLIQEPEFKKINGYIGRSFAPTAKATDTYIQEPSLDRQNYQLEPGLVIKNQSNEIEFFSSYLDVLNKISHHGGLVNNHSRLFSSEYYSFSGVTDFDKLVNFNQYYWLPQGPAAVTITSGGVPLENTYTILRASEVNAYKFNLLENELNPTIILSRGGTYKFDVNQLGSKFWIQTEIGTAGKQAGSPNLSTREIYGVENNGTDNGTVTFTVPQITQQDFYIKMPTAATVDYATDLSFAEVANQLLSKFLANKRGLDGTTIDLNNKTLIFTGYYNNPSAWSASGIFDYVGFDQEGVDIGQEVLDNTQQYGVWKITLEPVDAQNTDYIIRLSSLLPVNENEKVFVKQGKKNANVEFFKSPKKIFERVPYITAPISTLYYQDEKNPRLFGKIVLLDPFNLTLDAEADILGQKNYTSPNGVKFTNGLKIKFDSSVVPSSYANNTYYVEGVGKGIVLVNTTLLVTPESNLATYSVPYDTTNYDIGLYDESSSDPVLPDYIVSNRASQDLNPWARQNRWFHEDVIRQTATYNKTSILLDQTLRAKRPIIEFNPGLQLFNFAQNGKRPVDILDFTITNAFSQLENSSVLYNFGLGLETGTRIIFANDNDVLVKNKIYQVKLVSINNQTKIHLELASDAEINPLDGVVVLQGAQRGTSYWFDGSNWQVSQQKTTNQQAPLFDITDQTGKSLAQLPNSNFAGSKLFSYKQGTGKVDSVLGMTIGYRSSSFNSISDIEFVNNFETDTVTHDGGTEKISKYYIKENQKNNFKLLNTWSTVNQLSRQYQILSYQFDGTTNYFDIDIKAEETTVSENFKVYINNQRLDASQYQITAVNARPVIKINESVLTINDRIDFKIYSKTSSSTGYYEVPVNLDFNALNQGFEYLTLGQLRNHLNAIADNNINLKGKQPGSNNIRDLDIQNFPGTILQHSAPTIYSNLFLLDSTINFIDALTLAQKEYARFKNKFLEAAATTPALPLDDPITGVDQILQNINLVKTSQFPWYRSDMVPYGALKTTIEYTVNDKNIKDFEITKIFNDSQISATAVLVYHQPISQQITGEVQNKKNVLTHVSPLTFKKVYVGQKVTGINVPNGTYIVDIKNTGHQDTSTITLNNDLLIVSGAVITTVLTTVSAKTQLVKDVTYSFNKSAPAITLNCELNYGDKITIEEYESTDGNYIPETPTKLGLYPKFEPKIFLDNTYSQPIYVIQGHDGSITPSFGDYRDQYLLELEKRIYNNIKIDSRKIELELYQRLPGKFRSNDYSLPEFNKVISKSFLNWVGNNQIDFSSNVGYEANNSFSWNYKKFNDIINNEPLPGYWRGIFKYFYDTDRPHTHPWEMFGFSQQPDWWEQRYGPTPITSENVTLWQDVRTGYIAAGERKGVHVAFARPSIDKIIPVDEFGNLRSPEKFAIKSFNSAMAAGDWAVGDHGPAESAWRRSSEYPYAIQLAMAICYPAYYFSILLDTSRYQINEKLKQYVWADTNQKIKPSLIKVANATTRTSGYINWVVDYLTNGGFDAAEKINNYLARLNVQLVYKAAGYLDKKYLTILAEQSSPSSVNESIILPNENYKIHLTKSPPTGRIVYSAVIVKKTQSGYSVQGYDLNNPYFTVIPSLADNQNYTIEILGQRGVVYENYQAIKVNFPYGHEFTTKQQLVDFLVGYQRYLITQGFIFDQYNTDLNETQNWLLSIKEFLTWSAQQWAPGSVLILSPAYDTIKLVTYVGNVDEIKINPTGSRVLDVAFQAINTNAFVCSRVDNQFELSLMNQVTIGLVELHLVEYEHSIVLDNETVFSDVIYKSELGNRQFRLKLIGNKTANWNGTLSPAGFIYNDPTVRAWTAGKDYKRNDLVEYKKRYFVANENTPAAEKFNFFQWTEIEKTQIKSGLLPNFAYNAGRLATINDIDDIPSDAVIEQYSVGMIGFKPRGYLSDLNVPKTSQAKFYQGFLKEKGTMAAISALGYSQFADLQSKIDVYEEWAIRVGEYGALNAKQEIEIVLDEEKIRSNPTTLRLFDQVSSNLPAVVDIGVENIYVNAGQEFVPFANRTRDTNIENDILTAGYVNAADVDMGLFDITQYQALSRELENIGTGYRIWTARDFNGSWNVYRVGNPNIVVSQLTYLLNSVVQLETETPHALAVDQLFLVKNVGFGADGFYRVLEVVDNNTINVLYSGDSTAIQAAAALAVNGQLLTVDSVRFSQLSDIANFVPIGGWQDGDKIWVDNENAAEQWAVLTKETAWKSSEELSWNSDDLVPNARLGAAVKFLRTSPTLLAVSQPAANFGSIHVFAKVNNEYTKLQKLTLPSSTAATNQLGKTLETANQCLYASATGWNNQSGLVAIYQYISDQLKLASVLTAPTPAANAKYGTSIAASETGHRLYVGSPGTNEVFAYASVPVEYAEETISLTANIAYTVTSLASSTIIYNESNLYIQGQDYTFESGQITFTSPPVTGTYTIVQATGHTLIHTFTEQNSIEYGTSIKTTTDGLQLLVADPAYTATDNETNYLQAGKFYLYDKIVEAYKGNGTNTQFSTRREISPATTVVRVDNQTLNYGIDYQITDPTSLTFVRAPGKSEVIRIETNEYKKIFDKDILNDYAKLGTAVDICPYNCSLFVSAPQFDTNEYHSGIVQKYTNAGRAYGVVTGKVYDPTVTVGDSIRLNDFEIVFTDTTVESIVEAINQAAIPGVSATIRNRAIEIKSDSRINTDKLRILPGSGVALENLGLDVFELTQTIYHPNNIDGENFGTAVRVDPANPNNLLIASSNAPSFLDTSFDNNETVVDAGITKLVDKISGTGTVYLLQYMGNTNQNIQNPGKYAHVQQLETLMLDFGDDFGASMDIKDFEIAVSAPKDDQLSVDTGQIYVFSNLTQNNSWKKTRQWDKKVDIDLIDGLYIYDKETKKIIQRLDFIDPSKGKILGLAKENIDFVTEYDPARYNQGNNAGTSINPDYFWAKNEVGKIWWDVSTVRYVDYEQGDVAYRTAVWGNMFPGSQVQVYEWVESTVLPSNYSALSTDGTPKHPDNSAYVSVQVIDPTTTNLRTYYYYWVGNKAKIGDKTTKSLSTQAIARYIEEPQLQSVPYAAFVKDNAIALFNVNQLLVDQSRVLHINYSPVFNNNLIHSEYSLVKENDAGARIPERVLAKLVDSLIGKDQANQPVPDPLLKDGEKLGLMLRPRQTLFVYRQPAVKNFVQFVNQKLKLFPALTSKSTEKLYEQESEPRGITDIESDLFFNQAVNSHDELSYINTAVLVGGYKVLVKIDALSNNRWAIYKLNNLAQFERTQVQKIKTADYWKEIDWYAVDYDATAKTNFTVDLTKDISKLTLSEGDTVKVKNNGRGQFEIYRVNENLRLVLVGAQNGTIQLLDTLYSQADQPNAEFRNIFAALQKDIFINEHAVMFNQLFFAMVNYILTEQPFVDWAFKTSFISVFHQLKKLEQFPNFIKDNQTYYDSYIKEVKPYRTKVREYQIDYTRLENASTYTTDFDLPGYWSPQFNTFRSPNGDQPSDVLLLDLPQYKAWRDHHDYEIESITIQNSGFGYTLEPEVLITGGGGEGATARAFINADTGQVERIVVLDTGAGYTSQPMVIINGNGRGATAYAQLVNRKVRSFDTSLKFDRITYGTSITSWETQTNYEKDTILTYNGAAYKVLEAIDSGDTFDISKYQLVPAGELNNANDRTIAYYQPTTGMPPKDLGQLFTGLKYPGVKVDGWSLKQNATEASGFDTDPFASTGFDATVFNMVAGELELSPSIDSAIQSYFDDVLLGTRPEDINIVGGKFVDAWSSHAPEELVPGMIYDHLSIQVFTKLGSNESDPVLGYRITKDMVNNRRYHRISAENTTELAQDFQLADQEILVTDISLLPTPNARRGKPGTVFINGEKIIYYKIDRTRGALQQLRRAAAGTGAPAVHAAGSLVIDACEVQEIKNAHDKIWLAIGTTTPADGSGLAGSNQPQVTFLKEKPSFLP